MSSSSAGVCGRFDELPEVLEELDGPGVDARDDNMGGGEDTIGGGVTDTERWIGGRLIDGRARQKGAAPALEGWVMVVVILTLLAEGWGSSWGRDS